MTNECVGRVQKHADDTRQRWPCNLAGDVEPATYRVAALRFNHRFIYRRNRLVDVGFFGGLYHQRAKASAAIFSKSTAILRQDE